MFLSVIIPFYNEDDVIEDNIMQIINYLSPKFEFEIIIVNDSGKQNKILNVLNSNCDFIKYCENSTNLGKGASVRKGVKNSKGEFILLTDADLSSPIKQFDKLYQILLEGNDIVIGSRSTKESIIIIKQPILRILAGKIYNILIYLILGIKFYDTQCGFKLFNGEKLRKIISKTTSKGFGIDIELIYLAKKLNYKIYEVGITWIDKKNSSVKLLKDSLPMFIELINLRFK